MWEVLKITILLLRSAAKASAQTELKQEQLMGYRQTD
jgi:hypothetical protein